MKKQELAVTCSYGSEDMHIQDIILKSFQLFLKKELENSGAKPMPPPSAHV